MQGWDANSGLPPAHLGLFQTWLSPSLPHFLQDAERGQEHSLRPSLFTLKLQLHLSPLWASVSAPENGTNHLLIGPLAGYDEIKPHAFPQWPAHNRCSLNGSYYCDTYFVWGHGVGRDWFACGLKSFPLCFDLPSLNPRQLEPFKGLDTRSCFSRGLCISQELVE